MKIAMLISGGVDSSVALAMLKEQGHDITAFYLKIWLEDELSYLGHCPWQEDLHYVQAVCQQLDVPLEILSLQKEYHDRVVTNTISEIKQGRTPNPDMWCNQYIKFGLFFEHIDASFEKVATGHYAQIKEHNQRVQLLRSPDPIKDQSYFLAQVPLQHLSRALFPIGHLYKEQVRIYAHRYNLPTKDRKDSQGICFLGKLKFKDFVKHYMGEHPGDLIEFETGTIVGMHQGYWFYTIGQRQGIGLAGGPWYVVAKDPQRNAVFISRQYYAQDKPRNQVWITEGNWFGAPPAVGDTLTVKLRHGPHLIAATVNDIYKSYVHLNLATQDQGIAPGQFAVLYDGLICRGSGVIVEQETIDSIKRGS